jgi:hypothetical protein
VKNRPEGFLQATKFIHPNLRDVVLAGAVARAVTEPRRSVESLRGRISEGDREASPSGERQAENLFESLWAQSFGE